MQLFLMHTRQHTRSIEGSFSLFLAHFRPHAQENKSAPYCNFLHLSCGTYNTSHANCGSACHRWAYTNTFGWAHNNVLAMEYLKRFGTYWKAWVEKLHLSFRDLRTFSAVIYRISSSRICGSISVSMMPEAQSHHIIHIYNNFDHAQVLASASLKIAWLLNRYDAWMAFTTYCFTM